MWMFHAWTLDFPVTNERNEVFVMNYLNINLGEYLISYATQRAESCGSVVSYPQTLLHRWQFWHWYRALFLPPCHWSAGISRFPRSRRRTRRSWWQPSCRSTWCEKTEQRPEQHEYVPRCWLKAYFPLGSADQSSQWFSIFLTRP